METSRVDPGRGHSRSRRRCPPSRLDQTFESENRDLVIHLPCSTTSVTVLDQDIGDTLGGLGGDTSAARLRRWLPMTPLILVSGSRSPGGPMTPRGRGVDVLRRARHL